MASTTKIMTALVVLSHCRLDEAVTVSADAVGIEGSSVYLKVGEEQTVENLLYALLLASANDAAAALAIHVAGSIEAFAELMNEQARTLSLSDTHFTNPHGLYDEAHYTTAIDLARISAAAMENETFARIVATKSKVITTGDGETARTLQNHNKLLRLYEDCVGIKTGFTKKSGRCLVSAAERDGMRLIAVTLDAPDDWRDHAALLDLGFSLYEGYTVADGDLRFEIPVVGGTAESVSLSAKNPATVVLPQGSDAPTLSVEINRFAVAPIRAGQVLGMAYYTVNKKTVARVPLLAEEGVAVEKRKENLFDKIKHLFNL
ncbi:MAG: D-alanyl-D-alanine carboxypeptidase [Clostridia bacterium]|nr:D-alanyl-D-alanine carboxypeptidase [Clostridia bacterium]